METGIEITVENAYQTPRFFLELYTETGEKTTCLSDTIFSLTLTRNSRTITFPEYKSGEDIEFKFDYGIQDIFTTLSGNYTLTLTAGSQNLTWTVHLIGDGCDYSDEETYDLSKTYIEPINAVAVSGKTIEIIIQLRGKDGKRWNSNALDISRQLKVENSYNLEKGKDINWDFTIKDGFFGIIILKLSQNVITNTEDNILTIKLGEEYTFETKINFKVISIELENSYTEMAIREKGINGTFNLSNNNYMCYIYYKDIDSLYQLFENKEISIDNILDNLRYELRNNKLNILLDKIIIKDKKNIIYKDNNIIYELSSTDIKNNDNNISSINLRECENKLKINNNINIIINIKSRYL